MINKTAIHTPIEGYIDNYPQFAKIADDQIKIFWPWNEIRVEKDVQDLMVDMTPAERHATILVLKLFTKYELIVGNEYWSGRVMKTYPQPGIQRMAAAFAHVELNSHAPFYNEVNRVLGLNTQEFYEAWMQDENLVSRMKFLDELCSSEDPELATACFSLVEGAVLYSNFAYLKHFQAGGKNKMMNVCRGINMSARDENLHAIGGAGIVRAALSEQKRSVVEMVKFEQQVYEAAETILEHETFIVNEMFTQGPIENISAESLVEFVKSRLNLCLENLSLKPIFRVGDNPIADWFYKGINDYQLVDFFTGIGREYVRDWNKTGFVWKEN